MSITDRIRERQEERKKFQAEKEGKAYTPPTWPDGYPKLLGLNPAPLQGFIEERVIYRMLRNGKAKRKLRSYYVSEYAINCSFEFLDVQNNWNVLSFEEYKKECVELHELMKKNGKLTGRIQFSELIIFDEITISVPHKSIMELKPSPEEINLADEAFTADRESDFEKKSIDDNDYINSAEYIQRNRH